MNKFRYIIVSKKICFCALALVATLVLGTFTAVGWDKTLTVSSVNKKLPIYCVDSKDKRVALSFDAAWGDII